MIKVGITGGIGAGKSTVSKIFSILGVPVYDADSRGKELMRTDSTLKEEIMKEFGENAYSEGEEVNREYLAEKVFNNEDQLKRLNSLVHPAVGLDFADWCKKIRSPYVLKEAALLVETGSYEELDSLIVVSAPENLRVERVLMRDSHRSVDQIKSIIKKQLPEEKKRVLADFLIINDESHPILPQVLEIHILMTQRAHNNS